MTSPAHARTAIEYLRLAEQLEAMAATTARDDPFDPHFAQRLSRLSRQMREDWARLTPPGGAASS